MKIYGFKKVFEALITKNPSLKDIDRANEKARDKYTEILDAVGVDRKLLQTDKKIMDADGKTVKSGSYVFPESYVGFCADLISNYTLGDYKKLRKADFDSMSLGEVIFLVREFCMMLRDLGCPEETVLEQNYVMQRRMKLKLRLATDTLEFQLNEIREIADKYEHDSLTYCDKVYFLRYMSKRMKETKRIIESVYGSYTDIRFEEISEKALKSSCEESLRISADRMNKEIILFDTLGKDDEYQKLLDEMEELFAQNTFIKNKQHRFKKIRIALNKNP